MHRRDETQRDGGLALDWVAFYADIPIPLTKRVVCFDLGCTRNGPVFTLGWRYRRGA